MRDLAGFTRLSMAAAMLAAVSVCPVRATSWVEILTEPERRLVANTEDCSVSGPVRSVTILEADIDEQNREVGLRKTQVCEYDDKGNMVESLRYHYEDDTQPNPSSIEHISSRYDKEGHIIEVGSYEDTVSTASYSQRQVFEYDGRGRLAKWMFIDEDGEITSHNIFAYDSRGDQVREISEDGQTATPKVTEYQFDEDHHVVLQKSASVVIGRYRYNAKGQKIRSLSRLGEQWREERSTFDEVGQVMSLEIWIADVLPKAPGSDSLPISESLRLSTTTQYRYNAAGLETEKRVTDETGEIMDTRRVQYDAHGNVTQWYDYHRPYSGQAAAGRSSLVGDDRPETAYTYDARGNWIKAVQTSISDKGQRAPRDIDAIVYRRILYR